MQQALLIIHILVALALIVLVLLQHGKGADMGAAFGSGASQTLFGARGSANFLTRLTAGLATIFFITSLTLVYLSESGAPTSVVAPPSVTQQKPPASPPAAPKQLSPPPVPK